MGLDVLAPAIAAHAAKIAAAGLKASKTGATLAPRAPLPDDLLTRLAQAFRSRVYTLKRNDDGHFRHLPSVPENRP